MKLDSMKNSVAFKLISILKNSKATIDQLRSLVTAPSCDVDTTQPAHDVVSTSEFRRNEVETSFDEISTSFRRHFDDP